MQLTDAEIREILIREKRRKKRRQMQRRRRALAVLLLLIIILVVLAIHIKGRADSPASDSTDAAAADIEPRGVIFIDPGHGGEDPGSDNGIRYEKDDTLTLALAVRDQLKDLGFTVYMSREDDRSVDRTKRGEMANDCHAQLMVSIHRNSADGGDGVEAYIPAANDPESRLLAERIIEALVAQGFAEREIKSGMLMSPDEDYEENSASEMPSCLIEVGFISSETDNALFDSRLEDNAFAIAAAISDAFNSLYEQTGSDTADTEQAGSDQADSTDGDAN